MSSMPAGSVGVGAETFNADDVARRVVSGGAVADPFPLYAQLRERAPLHRASWGPWIVSRYADVAALLRDPWLSSRLELAKTRGSGVPQGEPEALRARLTRDWLVFRDPPDHTRLRTLVNQAFSPRRVQLLRSRIETLVDARLDELLQ